MSFRPFVKLGLISLMLVYSSTYATSDDKKYASQLSLLNCGGYNIAWIELQRKASGANSWTKVKQFIFGTGMGNGRWWCVDVSKYSEFGDGDQARLRVGIEAGEKKNCDNTNYAADGSVDGWDYYLREYKMAGSTTLNNGCRSKGYTRTVGPNLCSAGGKARSAGPCS
ncbi:MAG: hypothetical protein AAGB04_31290 [Pseudomonadota bacterium]